MSNECANIHELTNELKRHGFPFNELEISLNGIYILFEKDENGHQRDRIVRIGTHNGSNKLRSRLKEHFITKNKDRSIFRKHIGRALLKLRNDPFAEFWERDLTTSKSREDYISPTYLAYQKEIENQVSQYIQDKFTFVVFEVKNKEDRIEIEKKLISTISWCDECKASNNWLGNSSPNEKIVKSGLWLVNQLYKTPFDTDDIKYLSKIINS